MRPRHEHAVRRALVAGVTALGALFAVAPSPPAQGSQAPEPTTNTAAPTTEPTDVEAQDSPRASVRRFNELANKKKWAEAAEYLDVSGADPAHTEALAQQLHAVLTQYVIEGPKELSPLASGDKDDGLPPGVDELGVIDDPEGHPVHLRLVRREPTSNEEGARWVFSKRTLASLDAFDPDRETPWIREHVPAVLLRRGPKGARYWQLIAFPIAVALAWLVARGLTRLGIALARHVFDERGWLYRTLSRVESPVRVTWALVVMQLALPYFALPARLEDLSERLFAALTYLALFWAVLRLINVFGEDFIESAWVEERPTLRSFAHVGVRFVKVLAVAIAILAALARFGYPVGSVIAGLGLGGVVIALAAQKTVENLFGTISIVTDQPFRIGDVIRVDGVQGLVENIGLRSTRIRRVDGVLVIIPNGVLADQRIESLSERDAIRLALKLPVFRGVGAAAVRSLREAVRAAFLAHPCVLDDGLSVDLCSVEESWFELEIAGFIATRSITEFERVRGELLEACIDAARRSGADIALPARATIVRT